MKRILSISILVFVLMGCGTTKKNVKKSEIKGSPKKDLPKINVEQKKKFEKVKVGFVYISSPGDAGWTKAHDEARKLMGKLSFVTNTYFVQNIEEKEKDCVEALQKLIDMGCNLIFTTSWGYMDPTLKLAKQYPDIVFMHCSGFKRRPTWEPILEGCTTHVIFRV